MSRDLPPRPDNPDEDTPDAGTSDAGTPDAGTSDTGTPPGYFPRLLSAAALVSHAAADGALEQFGLNRSSFGLLGRLEAGSATECVLAEGTGQSLQTTRRELFALQSSGYVVEAEAWSITETGRKVIKCAQLAEAEITLDAADSQELRKALRTLITSLGLEQTDR